MVHLDYRDAKPIYAQIVDGVRNQINAGILQVGDKLPSVRELAAELAINPNTIQRAYRELEMMGLIASVSGKGSFVCGTMQKSSQSTEALWGALDAAVADLRDSGITLEELLKHIEQGGNGHA